MFAINGLRTAAGQSAPGAAASLSSCATVLPPLILVRSASVRWVGAARSSVCIIAGGQAAPPITVRRKVLMRRLARP